MIVEVAARNEASAEVHGEDQGEDVMGDGLLVEVVGGVIVEMSDQLMTGILEMIIEVDSEEAEGLMTEIDSVQEEEITKEMDLVEETMTIIDLVVGEALTEEDLEGDLVEEEVIGVEDLEVREEVEVGALVEIPMRIAVPVIWGEEEEGPSITKEEEVVGWETEAEDDPNVKADGGKRQTNRRQLEVGGMLRIVDRAQMQMMVVLDPLLSWGTSMPHLQATTNKACP
ncbi:hypothetical protein J6590_055784 [Homalodisca vitripennis]|nr:hypothetical protein J6590_055784 [Homalodisca vitripennis]